MVWFLSKWDPIRLQISLWIFALLFVCAMIIWLTVHKRIRWKLKDGKIPSYKIKGIIKSVECVRAQTRYSKSNRIVWRYISVEAIDPITKKKKIYDSNSFEYPLSSRKSWFSSFKKNKLKFDKYIKTRVNIWNPAEIIISKENPKIYYILEPGK